MGNHMAVKTSDNHAYTFDLRKLENKTRIYGPVYQKFLEDYKMERSDYITLDFFRRGDYVRIHARDYNSIPKQRIVVEGM